MSERTARVDELLREEISAIIAREIADPRIGFVTVTDVDVTADLRHATVWVSVIGQKGEREESVRALGRAMPFVRRELGVLRLKRIPELHLRLDDTAERGTRVLRILHELEEGAEPGPSLADETLPTPAARASERPDLVVPPPEDVPPGPRVRRPGSRGPGDRHAGRPDRRGGGRRR